MATKLPPPPVQQPITDKNGIMSPIWWTWFQLCFNRIGGTVATSPPELQVLTAFDDIARAPQHEEIINQTIAIFEQSTDGAQFLPLIKALATMIAAQDVARPQAKQVDPRIFDSERAPQKLVDYRIFDNDPRNFKLPQQDPMLANIAHGHPIGAVQGLQAALDEISTGGNVDGGHADTVFTVGMVVDGGNA